MPALNVNSIPNKDGFIMGRSGLTMAVSALKLFPFAQMIEHTYESGQNMYTISQNQYNRPRFIYFYEPGVYYILAVKRSFNRNNLSSMYFTTDAETVSYDIQSQNNTNASFQLIGTELLQVTVKEATSSSPIIVRIRFSTNYYNTNSTQGIYYDGIYIFGAWMYETPTVSTTGY